VLLEGERSPTLDEFVVRWQWHPLQLLASQTHDTKRAGDVRARIGALAGMHEQWAERVRRWHALTGGMDDPNEE
jgi:(1->4)-alpha-D-glucan 1-alpha-D-glucosylmutase